MQPERVSEKAPAQVGGKSGGNQTTTGSGSRQTRQLRGLDFASGQKMLDPGTSAPPSPGPAKRPMAMTEIQTRLNALGFNCGEVDGKIGVKTRAAIKAFQEANGLEVDGIVGPLTAAALRNAGGGTTEVKTEAPVTTPTTPEPKVEAPVTTPTTPEPKVEAPVTTPTTPEVKVEAPVTTPTTTTTPEVKPEEPKPEEPAWKSDRSILLPVEDITKLSYEDCLVYLDSRPRDHVEALGKDNKFVGYAIGFDVEKTAQLAVRIILRTPDAVVEKGASHAEAVRILTSQLRDKGVIRRLLAAEVRVVIVPANKLMTDLPEFAAQKGTYTFDGRPWDTVRGLGGKNTAITEENLLGVTEMDSSIGRKGWANQAAMDNAIKSGNTAPNEAGKDGPTDSDAVMNNPGVYCEGYSTTNHEFFHTIHMFGLTKQDSQTIDKEYKAKKSMPKATHWADGPRLMPDGVTESENYASSTVYEYFAQTGCAFQGTNTGTDPYTGNPRNNGRSWVTTNEPGLAGIYSRVCSDTELKDVNPTQARKAQEEKKKKEATAPSGPMTGATKTGTPPPPPVSTAMGFIQEK